MTESEAVTWLSEMESVLYETTYTIVLCAPFTLLSSLQKHIVAKKLPLLLGAQDISPFDKGAYTGAVNGEQIAEYAQYVLIGHSERRNFFHEDDSLLTQKVIMAKKYQLTPIFCVQGSETGIPNDVEIIAFEPIGAIGSGEADSPEDANSVAQKVKMNEHIKNVLYGGSVTSKNVASFVTMDSINGVLVGGASLHSQEFSEIIQNA